MQEDLKYTFKQILLDIKFPRLERIGLDFDYGNQEIEGYLQILI